MQLGLKSGGGGGMFSACVLQCGSLQCINDYVLCLLVSFVHASKFCRVHM